MRVSRLFAWASALGALVTVAVIYDRLPDLLPVTRWSSAPRSQVLAFRVPAINVLSLALVEVLVRPLLRSSFKLEAEKVATALFLTVGIKAMIEAAELFLLPSSSWLLSAALGLTLLLGLAAAIAVGRKFADRVSRPKLEFTTSERAITGLSLLAIVGLQLAPVLLPR